MSCANLPPPTLSSRIRGSLYGVAITDALGGPVEFRPRGSFPPVTKFHYNPNFDLAPGTWTDDTSMTLCLAASLVERGLFDVGDQLGRYVRWMEEGYLSATGVCFDIGIGTRRALGIWRECLDEGEGVRVEEGQGRIDEVLRHEMSCGNGSLMRCAPIPLVYHRDYDTALVFAALASRPTHPHPTCLEACQIYTHLIAHILSNPGISKVDLWNSLEVFASWKELERASPENTSALRDTFYKKSDLDSFMSRKEDEIKSSGYVVHTLEAALWAFWTTETLREGALKVVNLGDDADTVGAVYGGVAGAWYGVEEIPKEWIDGLQAKSMVDEVVEGVVKLVERGNNE